jgi:hypothetical protein
MWQPMFSFAAATLQALPHAQIALFFPELALTADGKPSLIDMLLNFLKARPGPCTH